MPETQSPRETSGVTLGDVFGGIHNSIIAGRDVVLNFFAGGTSAQRERRDRNAMLQLVRSFWIEGYLEPSLHGAARIELGLVEKADALSHPWKTVVEVKDQPAHLLPPGTPILDVFDAAGQSLLILGEPGGGKTTTLLELARDAIARAEEDESQPIPVVFNLSSWKRGKSLDTWIVEELDGKYFVPKKIGRRWLENDELLLLFDGLDEVAEPDRQACVEAINAFRAESPMPFAVCCRSREYEELSVRLRVKGEVVLQDLTPEQVTEYLKDAGDKLAGVREALRNDPTLEDLTKSPLMLSVMTLAYGGMPAADLQSKASPEERRSHLFDTYIRRMFERRPSAEYSPRQIVRWLSWLARAMQRQGETVLVVERMQPAWLEGAGPRWRYSLISRLISVVCFSVLAMIAAPIELWGPLGLALAAGLGFGVMEGLRQSFKRVGSPKSTFGRGSYFLAVICSVSLTVSLACLAFRLSPSDSVQLGLGTGVLLGFVFGRSMPGKMDIRLPNRLGWSWRGALTGLVLFWALGIMVLIPLYATYGVIGVAVGGLLPGLVGGAVGGLNPRHVEIQGEPGVVLATCLRGTIYISLFCGLAAGIVLGFLIVLGDAAFVPPLYALVEALQRGLEAIPTPAAFTFFLCGGFELLKHFSLRFVLVRDRHAPWRAFRFLDEASRLVFLRRVGGGYVFAHRLLLEHFASVVPEPSSLPVTRPAATTGRRIRFRALHWQWIAAALLGLTWVGLGVAYRSAPLRRARMVLSLCEQAEKHTQQSQWDEALRLYDRAVALDPAFAPAHEDRGEVLRARALVFQDSGRTEEARTAFKRAVAEFTQALERGYYRPWDTYDSRAQVHLLTGDLDSAIQDASKAIELKPGDPGGWSSRAFALSRRGLSREREGRLEEARRDYLQTIADSTRALELGTPIPSVLSALLDTRAFAYEAMGNRERAHADLRRAAKIDSDSASTLSGLCKDGSLWGRAAEVLPWCDQAVALEPDNPRWRDRRGIARALAGDVKGAADDFAAYLQWAETGYPVPEVLASRRAWLAALRAGRNPFDAETVRRLRYE